VQKDNYDSAANHPTYGQPQGRREAYDLAVVCYPSLSIDLLYDFKKVQPMPNHIPRFFLLYL
jgi:hypothetical protein